MPGTINATVTPEYPNDVSHIFRDKAIWEWVAGDDAPDEDTFTGEDSTAYMEGWLKDRTFLEDALAFFIGYSWVDRDDPSLLLNRKLPVFNPRWPNLRCSRVSIKGTKSKGQDDDPNGGEGLPLPLYDRYRFRVYFDGLPYDCRPDDDVDTEGSGEWGRFLTIDPEDASELFIQEGGSYTYVNSQNPVPPPFASTGVGIQTGLPLLAGGLRVYAQRTDLIVTAYQVAHDLILDDWGLPRKFMLAKNKVNSLTFLNRAPGTMLLKGFKIKKTPQPVATTNLGRLLFGCRVEMRFSFTDPPRADPAETNRGWLLAPGFDTTSFSGWYYVKDTNNKALYDAVDFYQLLTHQSFTTGGF